MKIKTEKQPVCILKIKRSRKELSKKKQNIAQKNNIGMGILPAIFCALSLWSLPYNEVNAAVTFSPAPPVELGGAGVGERIAIGDFNGDGYPDFVTSPVQAGTGTVTEDGLNVVYGNGTGEPPLSITFVAGASLTDVVSADINADGRTDLFIAETFLTISTLPEGILPRLTSTCNSLNSQVPIYLGNIGTGFSKQSCLNVPAYNDSGSGDWDPGSIAIGDFDEDGHLDAIVMNSYSSLKVLNDNAYYFHGNGDGTFLPGLVVATASKVKDLVVADVNNDAHLDVVTEGSVYLGQGNGTFNFVSNGTAAPARFDVGDLNGDGSVDRVVLNTTGVSPQLGTTDGRFTKLPDLVAGQGPADVAVADLDGDGLDDIVIANADSNAISIYYSEVNAGTLGFSPEQSIASGTTPVAVAITDWNGDGCADILTPNLNITKGEAQDGTVTILQQQVCQGATARTDNAVTTENATAVINLLANDSSSNGTLLNNSCTIIRPPAHGSLNVTDASAVTYTPVAGFSGADNFSYTVSTSTGVTTNIATANIVVKSANQAPFAVNDTAVTDQNVDVTIDVLANDSDVEPGGSIDPTSLKSIKVIKSLGGSSSSVVANNLVFTPRSNFSGIFNVHYTVNDNEGKASNIGTVIVNVRNPDLNQPGLGFPATTDLTVTTRASQKTTIDFSSHISLDPATTLTSMNLESKLPTTKGGWVWMSPSSKSATYVSAPFPAGFISDVDSFTYYVRDSNGGISNVSTVTININEGNLPPVAVNDVATTPAGVAVTIDVLANDYDVDGGSLLPLFTAVATPPASGTTAVNSTTGAITFTPAAGTLGLVSFTYTVPDNNFTVSNPATVTIDVTAANTAPVAVGDNYAIIEGGTLMVAVDGVLDLLANDSDADGEMLTVNSLPVVGPAHGSLNLGMDGSFTYIHDGSESVSDSFVYEINDGTGTANATAITTVTINIIAQNDIPQIVGQTVAPLPVLEDTALTLSLNNLSVTDPDNVYPTDFSLSVQAGMNYTTLGNTITPAANFNGLLSVPVLVNDGTDNSNVYNVSVTVTAINDAPVISAQLPLATTQDTALNISLTDLSVTDVDNSYPTGFSLSIQSGVNYTVLGTSITPAAGFSGLLTVPVVVNDGVDNSNVFNLSVNVAAVVNAVPLITGQTPLSTNEDTSLTITLLDLTVSDADNLYPADFTLSVLGGANYSVLGNTITPAANFNGLLNVPVLVNDGTDNSNVYNASVTVTAVNDAPVISAQLPLSTAQDTALNISLTDLSVTDVDNSYPIGFSLSIQLGVNYTVLGTSITPAAGFSGLLTVPVVVNDGVDNSNVLNLSVNVTATANSVPLITGQSPLSTNEDTSLVILLTHLTVTDADNNYPADFSLTVLPGVNYSVVGHNITPSLNYTGLLTVPVSVNDGLADSTVFNLSITVLAVNDAPIANADSYQVQQGGVLSITAPGVLLNDSDVDSVTLTTTGIATGALGNVTLSADGSFSYSPAAGAVAGDTDSFTYQATDGASTSLTATVTINIIAPAGNNVAPKVEGDAITYSRSANGDAPMTFSINDLLLNDQDPDDPAFPLGASVQLVDANGDGFADTKSDGSAIVNNGDGTLTYTPPVSGLGDDGFQYKAVDSLGGVSGNATVELKIIR